MNKYTVETLIATKEAHPTGGGGLDTKLIKVSVEATCEEEAGDIAYEKIVDEYDPAFILEDFMWEVREEP